MNFRTFSRTIRIRIALQFITVMGNTTVMPYLIIFFAGKLGTFVTGFMFLGVATASVIGTIIGGFISDRKGRKNVIVMSESVVFLCFIGVAIMNSPWFDLAYVTFILFVIIYFFSSMAGPAYSAIIIDESSPDNRKAVYTFSFWSNNLAFAVGGVVGGFLFEDYHFFLFLSVAMITLLTLLITIVYIQDSYVSRQSETAISLTKLNSHSLLEGFQSYQEVINDKRFFAFAVANLLIFSIEEQLTNYIGLRLTTEIADPTLLTWFLPIEVTGLNLIGILRAENTLLIVLFTALIAYVFNKVKDRFRLLCGLSLYFGGYIFLSFYTTPLILVIAMFFATIGELMHIPVKQAMLANMVPDHARSTFMAFYSLMGVFGGVFAGLFIFLSGKVPAHIISGCFLAIAIVTIAIFSLLTREDKASMETKLISEKS